MRGEDRRQAAARGAGAPPNACLRSCKGTPLWPDTQGTILASNYLRSPPLFPPYLPLRRYGVASPRPPGWTGSPQSSPTASPYLPGVMDSGVRQAPQSSPWRLPSWSPPAMGNGMQQRQGRYSGAGQQYSSPSSSAAGAVPTSGASHQLLPLWSPSGKSLFTAMPHGSPPAHWEDNIRADPGEGAKGTNPAGEDNPHVVVTPTNPGAGGPHVVTPAKVHADEDPMATLLHRQLAELENLTAALGKRL